MGLKTGEGSGNQVCVWGRGVGVYARSHDSVLYPGSSSITVIHQATRTMSEQKQLTRTHTDSHTHTH